MTFALLMLLAQDLPELSSQGSAAMRTGRYEDAIRVYRQLAALDSANPMWRMNLGMAFASAGLHSGAVTELAAFVQIRPQPGPAHLLLGLSLLKLEKPCEAIAPLESAKRWQARPDTVFVELGDANYGCKRWESAANAYAEARRAKPLPQLDARIARCWWLARKYEQARRAYRAVSAAQLDRDAQVQYEYGDTLLRIEGAAAGLPWLQKAVATSPDLAAAHGALGRALMELQRPADAAPHLEVAAKEDPALLLSLSKAYRELGKTAEAARTEAEYKAKIAR